jgi:hypothetical protein
MIDQNEDDEPKNEKITTMWGASEKMRIIDYCYKRGVKVSEQLRIIIKESLQFREHWHSLEGRVKQLLKDKADQWELVSYYFNRTRHYRNENKRLLEFIEKHNLQIPSGMRYRFNKDRA